MRALLYLRVSTEDQAASGAGLNGQRDAMLALARRSGWEVGGEWSDEGSSGATPLSGRPGLLGAVSSLGRGDCLVVAKRDRLGRDPVAVAMIEAAVDRVGARIVSAAGEGTEGNDPSNVLMRRMVDAFAEYERLIIKSRTRSALAAKRARGERTGRVPFGFDLAPDDARRSKAGLAVALVPNPAEQATILEILGLARSGMTSARIAADLRARGVPTKTGAAWSNMAVRRLLARPASSNPDPSGS